MSMVFIYIKVDDTEIMLKIHEKIIERNVLSGRKRILIGYFSVKKFPNFDSSMIFFQNLFIYKIPS